MPSVPRLSQNQVAPAPLQIASRQAAPSAVQAVGGAIQETAGAFFEIQQRERQLADQIAVTEADRLLGQTENTLLHDPQKGALTRQGKDAIGIGTTTLTEYDAQAAQIEQGLTAPRAKQVFREALGKRRLDVERRLADHEVQQHEVHADNEAKAYLNESVNSAANNWDVPARTDQELQRQRAVIDHQASRQGWSDAQKSEALRAAQSDTHTAILSRMIGSQETDKASEYLGRVRDSLDSETVTKAEKAIATARTDDTANRIIGVYAQNGPDAGAAVLDKLSKSGLSQEQLGDIYSKVQTGTSQIRAQRQQLYAQDLKRIYEDVATGKAGASTASAVDSLWRHGALSPVEYASLNGRVEDARIQGAGDSSAAAEIRASLESGVPLDPSNTAQRKALDLAFSEDVAQLKPGSAPWLQAASAYAARTRIVPSQASSWARSSLRSPNPAIAVPAAQFVAAIEATAGDAVSSFDTDTKSMAGVMNQLITGGADPQKAIELSRETVFERKPAITKDRREAYNNGQDALAKGSDSALDSFINRDFDTAFTRQPDATAGMKVDFRSQAEQYYLRTGDISLARQLAWTDLNKVYGVSEVNGVKQMIAFPPERYGLKPEDIRSDVGGFLKDNPQSDGSIAEEIILVPDALTLQAVDSLMNGEPGTPSYKLVTKSGDLVVDSKGIPKRYTLPNGEEMGQRIVAAQKAAADTARQQVQDARTQRELDRKRRYERALMRR